MSDEENQQSQIITQELCKDEDICDYINLEQKGDNVQITIANETEKTSIKNKKSLEDLQQIILDTEGNNIKEMFMILNQKIPNFFNHIKYDFKVLSEFNTFYPEEKRKKNMK